LAVTEALAIVRVSTTRVELLEATAALYWLPIGTAVLLEL
jgi:hypothetical protein